MKLCRACLSANIDLFTSDDNFIYNYNLLTNLNVKPYDGKSQLFCQTCIDAVNFFIDFRNKCMFAESNLQGSCTEQGIKYEKKENDTEFVIKEEIKCEIDTLMRFEDDNHESNDDTFYIKKEEKIKIKKPRKKIKKEKSSKTKKTASFKGAPKVASGVEIYKKLPTNKPACGLCGEIFEDATSLNQHVEGHKADKHCKLCHQPFDHWAQLLAHRLLHTVQSHSCHMCNKKFQSDLSLQYHYRKVHCKENDIKLSCEQCEKTFFTPRRLRIHISANHSNNKFICDICSKEFKSKGVLKSHIISHGDIKGFICHLCGYSSKYSGGLQAHTIRVHTPSENKMVCQKCFTIFADPVKLKKHVCTDRSKICPICGKRFRKGEPYIARGPTRTWPVFHCSCAQFGRHMDVHREENRYKCLRCPKSYRSRTALKEHEDKHDNNPTQQCEYCQRRFYSRSVLIKHRRVHTGEKPYACKKCDMRFTGNNNLKLHMKVHGEMLIVKKEAHTD